MFKKIGEVSDVKSLISTVSAQLQAEGYDEKAYNLEKALETKALETKANEIMHTGNTGYGAELIPGAIQTTDFLDLVPQYSSFIGALRGNHGKNLNKIQEVPITGFLAKHQLVDESTTGSMSSLVAQGLGKMPTGKVTITQKKYLFSVDVSDEEVRFTNVVDLVALINKKLARSSAETMEALILNGDTATGATGNVNSDDGAPTAGTYYLGADGLRKQAFTDSATASVGTLAFSSFTNALAGLGKWASRPSDVFWLFNQQTYVKSLAIAEFAQQYINGKNSTVNTGAISNILGSDVFLAYDFGLTEADGKISVTPANNVKGGFMAIHRDAVQYGFSGDYQLEVFRAPGKGWQVLGYYYMGVAIANKISGVNAENAIYLGINATV